MVEGFTPSLPAYNDYVGNNSPLAPLFHGIPQLYR